MRHYHPGESVLFRKTRDPFGALSNMCHGFPLSIGTTEIRTSEALYQALKYPLYPDIQQDILVQKSPMAAKMRSRFHSHHERKDWMKIRVQVMRWCITLKLFQHWDAFGQILKDSAGRHIVEHSERDQFWGASEGTDGLFHGVNCLGRLLMQLRDQMEKGELTSLEPLPIENFLLLEHAIGTFHRL